jgi:hypothetical protein
LAAGRPEHYEIAVLTALYCRRVMLIETDTAHRAAWLALLAPTGVVHPTRPPPPALWCSG